MGGLSLKRNALKGVVLGTLLAIPGIAEAGTARTDLPTCDEAKTILQKDSRAKVEEWATQICLCADAGSLGKKVKNNILTQSQYDDKCGTGALSKNAPQVANVPAQRPPVQQTPTPTPPKASAPKAQTPPSNANKGKTDGGTPDAGKPEEGATGAESANSIPEIPNEAIWALLGLLGAGALEGLFRHKNKKLREFIKKAQDANKEWAKAWDDKGYLPKAAEEDSLPFYGTLKSYLTNKNLYKIEVAENKKFEKKLKE